MSDTVEEEVAAPPAVTRPDLTTAQMVERFVKLRDKKKEIEDRHKKELAPLNLIMAQLEAFMMSDLHAAGGESLKTEHGTIFFSTRTSATVSDWSMTFQYIYDNQLWDLLEHRVSKTAVLQDIEEKGAPVPGVKVTQDVTLNVRRA
jgi:hypothetical protein